MLWIKTRRFTRKINQYPSPHGQKSLVIRELPHQEYPIYPGSRRGRLAGTWGEHRQFPTEAVAVGPTLQ